MDDTLILFGEGARAGVAHLCCPRCGQRRAAGNHECCGESESLVREDPKPQGTDPLVGQVVDQRYEVVEFLGEGGMGSVYRVCHLALGRFRAMKVLRQDLARDKALSARFVQEARAAAAVSHPSVVEIMDYGVLPSGQPYFVMELLSGIPLIDIIRGSRALPVARILDIVRQTAQGLGAAHAAGIVHRDLKPDNIHLCQEGGHELVKVLDFGLAQITGSGRLTRRGMVFGTPHYMSPEQASGDPVDHRADIYALGVVAYQMLTGRVPFDSDTYMGVLTKHMYLRPVSPSSLRAISQEREDASRPAWAEEGRGNGADGEWAGLEAITLRCLEKQPDHRFPDMAALVEALDELEVELSGQSTAQRGAQLFPFLEKDSANRILAVPAARPGFWSWGGLAPLIGLASASILLGTASFSLWWFHSRGETDHLAQVQAGSQRRVGPTGGWSPAARDANPSLPSERPLPVILAPAVSGRLPARSPETTPTSPVVDPIVVVGGRAADPGDASGSPMNSPCGVRVEGPLPAAVPLSAGSSLGAPAPMVRPKVREVVTPSRKEPISHRDSSSMIVDPWAH